MSMPVIECKDISKCCAASSLLQSIALEEAAISHIINAEGEKLQKVIKDCESSTEDLLKVNASVESMIEKITSLEIVLKSKIDAILPILEDCSKHYPEHCEKPSKPCC